MIRFHLETNFLISFATKHNLTTIQLLEYCPPSVLRLIPSYCLMGVVYRTEAQAAERNEALPGSAELASHLQAVITHAMTAFTDFRRRLLDAISIRGDGSSFQLSGIGPGRFLSGYQISETRDPTDQLILATILDDAQEHVTDVKVFLTENDRCSHDNYGGPTSLGDGRHPIFRNGRELSAMVRGSGRNLE